MKQKVLLVQKLLSKIVLVIVDCQRPTEIVASETQNCSFFYGYSRL